MRNLTRPHPHPLVARRLATGRGNLESGVSLLEILMGTAILCVVAVFLSLALTLHSRNAAKLNDKAFATQKAMQMMEELRGVTMKFGSEPARIAVLDKYDDGASFNPVLTTQAGVTDPADAVSGNARERFARQIHISNVPNTASARRVTVGVYYNNAAHEPLAEIMSILRGGGSQSVPTQVYDVYFINIENVTGWWTTPNTLQASISGVLSDLQMRNPGLQIRPHWITRLAYGRDPLYKPYLNNTNGTWQLAWEPKNIYFYPNKTSIDPFGARDTYWYFPTEKIKGNMNIDGALTPGNTIYHYALADQFNHAVRYEEETAMNAIANALAPQEMSLRMLLEKMASGDPTVQNSIVINLHGEMTPFPPMRNYSDAAKDPAGHPYVRVVSHPENLQYPSSAPKVDFRVYTYLTSPDTYVNAALQDDIGGGVDDYARYPSTAAVETITIRIVTPSSSSLNVNNIKADVVCGNELQPTNPLFPTHGEDYVWEKNRKSADPSPCDAKGIQSYFTVSQPNPGEPVYLITLFNTPLRHGFNGERGLQRYRRLFGLEYIPCVLDGYPGSASFSGVNARDLTLSTASANAFDPKGWSSGGSPDPAPPFGPPFPPMGAPLAVNTARWVIHLGNPRDDGVYRLETRIGADTTTGWSPENPDNANQPQNVSRTYVYIGVNPPVTEQYQFIGDPRYMPYEDRYNARAYNWYGAQIHNFSWDGYNATQPPDTGYLDDTFNGPRPIYGSGTAEFPECLYSAYLGGSFVSGGAYNPYDYTRFTMIYRWALLNSGSVLVNPVGNAFYYFGLGGEFGGLFNSSYDFVFSGESTWSPWGRPGGASPIQVSVDEITTPWWLPWTGLTWTFSQSRLVARTDSSWAVVPYIGELFPDSWYKTWRNTGNLPTQDSSFSPLFWRPRYVRTDQWLNDPPGVWDMDPVKYRSYYLRHLGFCYRQTKEGGTGSVGCAFLNGNTTANNRDIFFQVGNVADESLGLLAPTNPLEPTYAGGALQDTFHISLPPVLDPRTFPTNQRLMRPFYVMLWSISLGACWPYWTYYWSPAQPLPEQGQWTWAKQRTALNLLDAYYTSSYDPYPGQIKPLLAGLYSVTTPATSDPPNKTGFFALNGVGPQWGIGSVEVGKIAVLMGLRGFFKGGSLAVTNPSPPAIPGVRIPQVPLISISTPTAADQFVNPVSIDVVYGSSWTLWNEMPYTADASNADAGAPLLVNLKYSRDGGSTWLFVGDAVTPARPGVLDYAHLIGAPLADNNPRTYTWMDPGTLPSGSYLLQVEAYRQDRPNMHYTYHQANVHIERR